MKKILLFLLLISSVALATNRYISPTGSNTIGDGSVGNPWKTITYALNDISNANLIGAGDTLFIKEGIYHEHGIQIRNTGTANNRIVIRSEHGKMATIDADSAGFCFDIGLYVPNNWITIDSLHLTDGLSCNINIGENYPDTAVIIKNCIIENHYMTEGGNCAGIRLIHGFPVNDTILNCVIRGNGYNNGNYVGINTMHFDGMLIKNCDISNCYTGIFFKHSNHNLLNPSKVENNFVHDNLVYGIFTNINNVTIVNNLVINNNKLTGEPSRGLWFWNEVGSCGGSNCHIEHNTVYGHDISMILYWGGVIVDSSISLVIPSALPVRGASYNIAVNNIFHSRGTDSRGSYLLWPSAPDSAFVNNPPRDSSDYNLYYNGAQTSVIGQKQTGYTLTNWKSYVYPTYDLNSIQAQPTFTNSSGTMDSIGDYILSNTSLGYHLASDGKDMGADVSLIGANIQYQPQTELMLNDGIDTLNFIVSANNAINYQWRVNNVPISEATSNKLTLRIDSTGYNDNEYDCVVSDGFSTVYSKKYKLHLDDFNRYINKR